MNQFFRRASLTACVSVLAVLGSFSTLTASLSVEETRTMWDANSDLWIWLLESEHAYFRNHVSGPAFMAALPEVAGKRGLDIGCGHGFVTRLAADKGASMTGLDISPNLIRYAESRELREHKGISYVEGDAMNLPFDSEAFDFVTAFCSFMDFADVDAALNEASRVIKPGGFFQMTIMHPCFWVQDNDWVVDDNNVRTAMIINSYFDHEEERIVDWYPEGLTQTELGDMKPFRTALYRRTLSEWINALAGSGFSIEYVDEPIPTEELVAEYPTLDGSRVVPYFLTLRCRKLSI